MIIQQALAKFLESADGGHIAFVHAAAGKQQQHLSMRTIRTIKRLVLLQKP